MTNTKMFKYIFMVMVIVFIAGAARFYFADDNQNASESMKTVIVEKSNLQITNGQERNAADVYTNADKISNNLDVLYKLHDEVWPALTDIDERIEVLQKIVYAEGRYLGLSTRLELVANDLGGEDKQGIFLIAYYSENNKQIIINSKFLTECSGEEAIKAVVHECRHSFQYEIADLYEGLDESQQLLQGIRSYSKWAEELKMYTLSNDAEDFQKYYEQSVEQDAREYAQESVADYMNKVNAYYEEKEGGSKE